jgi:2-iminoacetate synthase ThiH
MHSDKTLLFVEWVLDIEHVTIGELLSFADYAGWTVREVVERLRALGVKIVPEPVEERMLEALREGSVE